MDQRLAHFHNLALQITRDKEAAAIIAAIAAREGGLRGTVGDKGQSFGPLQFYTGGQLPGFARWLGVSVPEAARIARDSQQWDKVIRYAWDGYLGNAIRAGRQRGLEGSELATFASRHGQVSVQPELSGRQYANLFGGNYTPAASSLPPIPPAPSWRVYGPPGIPGMQALASEMPQGQSRGAKAIRDLMLTSLINWIPGMARQAMPKHVRMGRYRYDKDKLFKAVAPRPDVRQIDVPPQLPPAQGASGITTPAQQALAALVPNAVVSSGTRTPARNIAVSGKTTSAHLRGMALDLVPKKPGDWAGVLNKLQPLQARGAIRYVFGSPDHRDHVHVTILDPSKLN